MVFDSSGHLDLKGQPLKEEEFLDFALQLLGDPMPVQKKTKTKPKAALKAEAAQAGVSQKVYADALQHLEDEMEAISSGIKYLLYNTKLKEDALYLLIQNACPNIGGKKPTLQTVKAVVQAMENLEDFYLKKLDDSV